MKEIKEKKFSIWAAKTIMYESVYTRKCVLCDEVLKMHEYINLDINRYTDELCPKCRREIKYIENPSCMKCGKQIIEPQQEYCDDCKKSNHTFDSGVAVFNYSTKLKESIYRFKYCDCKIYGRFYGMEMANKYQRLILKWCPNVIIPVPIHKKRMKKRGYNQSEIIGKAVSQLSGVPIDNNILKRISNTLPQKDLNSTYRRKNVEKAFKTSEDIVKYKRVVLIDDIYTTGCTIDACAKELKSMGVEKVFFMTICIGSGI